MGELTPAPVSEARSLLGEGPVWDVEHQVLVWVDIVAKKILTTDPTNGITGSVSTPTEVGAVALVDSGGFAAAFTDGLYLGDGIGPWRQLAAIDDSDGTVRMNDGKCDPGGAFVGGTMARDGRATTAALYRIKCSGETQRLLGGLSISNGIDWTDDGATMYHIDTPTRRVMAYDYDRTVSELGGGRSVVEIPEAHGFPDGMTVDSEGCLWVALWGGRAVHRYTPDGCLDAVIELPVTNVTACAFGGQDLDTLFITTASVGVEEEKLSAEPLAGALFSVAVGVSGRAPTRFRSTDT